MISIGVRPEITANCIFFDMDDVFVYNGYPTWECAVLDVVHLVVALDDYRVAKGYKSYFREPMDAGVWYDFGVHVTALQPSETYIYATVCNADAPDDEEVYRIDLTEEQRLAVYELMRKVVGECGYDFDTGVDLTLAP